MRIYRKVRPAVYILTCLPAAEKIQKRSDRQPKFTNSTKIMEHGHTHAEHSHDHSPPDLSSINRAFYIGIALNAAFTAIEFILGYMHNSLALIADASHNLSDVASLLISLIGMKLAQKAATRAYTYGYKKASILASLINAILLVVVLIGIIKSGIARLSNTPEVPGEIIIITAGVGVLINTLSAFLFAKGRKNDINIKGAFLHLMIDAIISVGVVVSGIAIYYTGYNIIDPMISFVIAAAILLTTWGLLKESLKLTMDGVPKDINLSEIKETIKNKPGVVDVHHIHVWALSSTENALTAHIIMEGQEISTQKVDALRKEIKHDLEHMKIGHATIEFETEAFRCEGDEEEPELN